VYGYDAINRLRSVRRNGTLIARYAYDVGGRRIAKRVYSSASGGIVAYTRFVYHGANVAFETDSAGTIGLKYVWGPAADDLLAIHTASGNAFYVSQDLLHTPRGLVKRDGTWVMSQRFGPYGVRIAADSAGSGPGFELRYRWTGREYDAETGFYFHRTRYYDPALRRFVQEDKIAYAGGANLYAYAGGSPLEFRDPDGRRASLEPNPDWWNLDVFGGCFYHQCAEMQYFFGLTESGGGSEVRSYAGLLSCIGNASCNAPPQGVEYVLQLLTLAENLAWLDANVSPCECRIHIEGGFINRDGHFRLDVYGSGQVTMENYPDASNEQTVMARWQLHFAWADRIVQVPGGRVTPALDATWAAYGGSIWIAGRDGPITFFGMVWKEFNGGWFYETQGYSP